MTITRIIGAGAVFGAVGLAFATWYLANPTTNQTHDEPTWEIQADRWIETAGHYAVEVDMTRTAGGGFGNFDERDYTRWCQIVLANLPEHPSVVDPDIYRVGIRVTLQDGTNTQSFRPVAVRDNICHYVELGGFAYVTYPEPLEFWVPFRTSFGPSDGGFTLEAIFDWIGDADGSLDKFDAGAACAALLSDPPSVLTNWTGVEDITRVVVYAVSPTQEPMSRGFGFVVSDEKCLEMTELEL